MRGRKRSAPPQGQPGKVLPVRRPIVLPSPISNLNPFEAFDYLDQVSDRLKSKQQRELAYLDRRAARGTHTPTDDAYEADQQLEAELLFLINQLRMMLK